MAKAKPRYLEATIGEYAPMGFEGVRISDGGCIIEFDVKKLTKAECIERDVDVYGAVKRKSFTRIMVRGKSYLAERVTGTLYNELTGRTSSPYINLVM